MTFRQKTARSIRKWADLIDPRINPSVDNTLTVHMKLDASGVEETIASLEKGMATVLKEGRKIKQLLQ